MKHTTNILLTGPPGCGKTTAVKRILELLPNRRLSGFFTEEIRIEERRVGFDMVGLNGGRFRLSHVDSPSELRVSRYGVEIAGLEALVKSELIENALQAELIVIDEIAKAECFSEMFVERVSAILDSTAIVLATVAVSRHGFMAQVKDRSDVEIHEVTDNNREKLPQFIAKRLDQALSS